jgi:hypothetical protein
LTLDEQNTQLLQKDWLTTGLLEEIEALFPSSLEIKANDDNKRDPIAFQHKIAKLFPPGRIFASFKQLDQAADSSWCLGSQEDYSLQKHPMQWSVGEKICWLKESVLW